MAEQDEEAKQIIDGILADAREEAEKVKREARSRIEDRKMLLSGRLKRIKDDAASEARRRAEEIDRRTDAEIDRARRRHELTRQREVIEAVTRQARDRLRAVSARAAGTEADNRGRQAANAAPAGTEDPAAYRDILIGWIVEGVLALDGDRFTVSVGPEESALLSELLPEAAREVLSLSGTEVELEAAAEAHRGGTGVVVTSPDGRTLFDNRIDARIRRHETQIRRIVYEELFGGDGRLGERPTGDGGSAGDGGSR